MAEQKGRGHIGEDVLKQLERQIEDDLLRRVEAELDGGVTEETKTLIRENVRDRVQREIAEQVTRISDEVAADALAPERRSSEAEKDLKPEKEKEESFLRLPMNIRVQHMFLFTSVILLIITGLPLRFSEMGFAEPLIQLLGGIDNSRIIHRVAACGLIGVAAYHMLYTLISRQGRRDFVLLLPMPKDALDVFGMIKHFLGIAEERPKFGRFSYIEKFDYWAVYWGCVIMIGTGLALWFQDFSLTFLPKYALDVTKEVHRDEALLATMSIVIWHFYNVHFNPDKFPGSLTWFHGKITKHEMMEEHALEYEEIMAAKDQARQDDDEASVGKDI